MAKMKKTDNTDSWQDCGETGTLQDCRWEFKMLPLLQKISVFIVKPNTYLPMIQKFQSQLFIH